MDENSNLSLNNEFAALSAAFSPVQENNEASYGQPSISEAGQATVHANNADIPGVPPSTSGAATSKKSRRPAHYQSMSDDIRQTAIEMIKNGKSQAEVSKDLKIIPSTLSHIWSKFSKTGKKKKVKRGGPRFASKLDDQKLQIANWVKEDCTLTLKEIKERIKKEMDIDVSESTVSRLLSGLHYSLKKVSLQPTERNSEQTIEKRKVYAEMFTNLLPLRERFVFIDESGFSVSMGRFYGRSKPNERAVKQVRQVRSMNYTLTAAMTSESVYFFTVQDGPMNTEDFIKFLKDLLRYFDKEHLNERYLFMDNAKFHSRSSATN